jgi:hypothetical protein
MASTAARWRRSFSTTWRALQDWARSTSPWGMMTAPVRWRSDGEDGVGRVAAAVGDDQDLVVGVAPPEFAQEGEAGAAAGPALDCGGPG